MLEKPKEHSQTLYNQNLINASNKVIETTLIKQDHIIKASFNLNFIREQLELLRKDYKLRVKKDKEAK